MFKPMLFPNDNVDSSIVTKPMLASTKLDGIRCIFKDGEMISRSLKQIVNKQLQERFEHLKKYSKENGVILDGEIYSHKMTFQEITHFVMTQDLDKKGEVLPEHLKFYCFDCVYDEDYVKEFSERYEDILKISEEGHDYFMLVEQFGVDSPKEVDELFDDVIRSGYEGIMLKDPESPYKLGRATLKQGMGYKVKPFITFDAKVIGVVQATVVREGAERKTNELGRSVTSKKKADRVLIEKASAFWVNYDNGHKLKIPLAMTDSEKEEIWENREKQIGRWIEYKAMLVGAKDVPRIPIFIRFRDDKE